MRIAIAMRTFRNETIETSDDGAADAGECFANFEVQNDVSEVAVEDDDTVQVTVVLRGRREELEDPALGVTQLVLGALKAQAADGGAPRSERSVIDALGIAVSG